MKMIWFLSAGVGLLSMFISHSFLPALPQNYSPQYYSPLKNAQYVSTGATVVVRYGPILSAQDLAGVKFTVQGSKSGSHAGQVILADDHKTVIFKPTALFMPGEQVRVNINGLVLDGQTSYSPLSYTFTVAINKKPGDPGG